MTSADTIEDLWCRYKDTGDRAARDRLVVHYSPLVKYVAGRVGAGMPRGAAQEDLISDGVLGLLSAMEGFDLDRGLQFRTYAQQRIRGAMIDGLRASDWVPRQVREHTRDLNAATAALEHRLQRRPDATEVAGELGISQGELHDRSSKGSYTSVVSIDTEAMNGDVAAPGLEGVLGGADDLPDGFVAALQGLSERDQIVIALYYWERFSLAEVGQVLSVSESRVSQLMRRATLELRKRLAA